jgi:hypothetical protein
VELNQAQITVVDKKPTNIIVSGVVYSQPELKQEGQDDDVEDGADVEAAQVLEVDEEDQ